MARFGGRSHARSRSAALTRRPPGDGRRGRRRARPHPIATFVSHQDQKSARAPFSPHPGSQPLPCPDITGLIARGNPRSPTGGAKTFPSGRRSSLTNICSSHRRSGCEPCLTSWTTCSPPRRSPWLPIPTAAPRASGSSDAPERPPPGRCTASPRCARPPSEPATESGSGPSGSRLGALRRTAQRPPRSSLGRHTPDRACRRRRASVPRRSRDRRSRCAAKDRGRARRGCPPEAS